MARKIIVATDFSTRSDRALRRGVLLARQTGASLAVAHVVDDDLPPRLLEPERREAEALLGEIVRGLRKTDGLHCEERLLLGDPFEGIVRAGSELGADLLVLGPHRRQALRDVFVGTTAERTIRTGGLPVVMANGVPAGPYRRILLASDFSEAALHAAATARRLGLLQEAKPVVLHAFDAPAEGAMRRAAIAERQLEEYREEERRSAEQRLAGFLERAELLSARGLVVPRRGPAGQAIVDCAREQRADLVVVGTRGLTGLDRLVLGSVAEAVLAQATMDVLAVPPAAAAGSRP